MLGGGQASATPRTLTPIRHPLSSTLAPAEAVLWLRGDVMPFALVGDWLGGGTVLGSRPGGEGRPPVAAEIREWCCGLRERIRAGVTGGSKGRLNGLATG